MTRTSIIRYPSKSKSVVIREALVTLCFAAPDANCAAAILNQMIYWTDVKIDAAKQAKYHNEAAVREGKTPTHDESLWIYKNFEELQAELLNLFGRNRLIDNMAWLVESGFLEKRTNPLYRWDKTAQYRADIDLIQSRIQDVREFNIKLSKPRKQTLNRPVLNSQSSEIKPAIPEITTETTSETTTTTTTTAVRGGGSLPAASAVLPPASQTPAQPANSALPASKPESSKEKSSAKKESSGGTTDDGLALVTTAYESNIGMVTPLLSDEFKDVLEDYSAAWIVEAIGIAVKAEKRFWKYVLGILKKWKRDGKDTPAPASSAVAKPAAKQQQYVTVPAGTNPFTRVSTKEVSHE